MRESEAGLNRPGYLCPLAGDRLAALPEVRQRLRAAPPARVAGIGRGGGWSCIGLARGYPMPRVDDPGPGHASAELARRNLAAAGLADRVRVHHLDVTTAADRGPYDLVTAFECPLDLPDPVPAPAAMRRLAGQSGTVLRPGTVRESATQAGYARIDTLPIDHDPWRFTTCTRDRRPALNRGPRP